MNRGGPEPAIGEHWAYRERAQDELVEVAVIRLGIKTPARVLVRWVDDAFEGKQDWAPPARLKVPWLEAPALRDRERRWDAVTAPSEQFSEAIVDAVGTVFGLLVDERIATLGYNATSGVLHVRDAAALAEIAEFDRTALRDPTSFEDNLGAQEDGA